MPLRLSPGKTRSIVRAATRQPQDARGAEEEEEEEDERIFLDAATPGSAATVDRSPPTHTSAEAGTGASGPEGGSTWEDQAQNLVRSTGHEKAAWLDLNTVQALDAQTLLGALRWLDDHVRLSQHRDLFHEAWCEGKGTLCVAGKNRGCEAWNGAQVVLGLHPDQATEPIVDQALQASKSFAVMPCCVFPTLAPHRRHPKDKNRPVRSLADFLDYLQVSSIDTPSILPGSLVFRCSLIFRCSLFFTPPPSNHPVRRTVLSPASCFI